MLVTVTILSPTVLFISSSMKHFTQHIASYTIHWVFKIINFNCTYFTCLLHAKYEKLSHHLLLHALFLLSFNLKIKRFKITFTHCIKSHTLIEFVNFLQFIIEVFYKFSFFAKYSKFSSNINSYGSIPLNFWN